MNELIQQLQDKAGLTMEQAQKSLETIKHFVVEKFPMLAGAVDNIFPSTPATVATDNITTAMPVSNTTGITATTSATDTDAAVAAATVGAHAAANTPHENQSFMDKISDYIPGQAGEKIEDFVKKAAHEADNLFKKQH